MSCAQHYMSGSDTFAGRLSDPHVIVAHDIQYVRRRSEKTLASRASDSGQINTSGSLLKHEACQAVPWDHIQGTVCVAVKKGTT